MQTDNGSIDNLISEVHKRLPGERIADIFGNCYGNTVREALKAEPDGSVFVLTGDIPAMWLRDSACQMRPYLILCREDSVLCGLIEGVIRKQVSCVLSDPYANAFNETANGKGWQKDHTDMKPFLWERKYEIDSLCYPIQLSYLYWKNAGRVSHFTPEWRQAAKLIMATCRAEQHHEALSQYRFERTDCPAKDTLPRAGKGSPVKDGTGLVWSGFRPSDDACTYGYLIPSNMFLAVVLQYIAEIMSDVYGDDKTAEEAAVFAAEVRTAIEKYALIDSVYAYEVDGFGNYVLMDDANVPSLLAMPYFGYCGGNDGNWKNTKEMILSRRNPYYYEGSALKGIGSPHTPEGFVWDIGIAMEGLVSDSPEEKRAVLDCLAAHDAGTGLMHEGINCNDDHVYTREWFSWANALFCELVLDCLGMKIIR
jgi:meiotically up-regulated gene 157 (Mug157) protein